MPTKEMEKTQDVTDIFEKHESVRGNLIPILQEVQGRLGYLSEQSINDVAKYLNVSRNEVYGVATFYSQFRFTRPGDHVISVCQGTACHVRGGKRIMEEVCKKLGIGPGETTADYKFSIERVACFGSCALAPVVVVDGVVYGRMNPRKAKQLLEEIE